MKARAKKFPLAPAGRNFYLFGFLLSDYRRKHAGDNRNDDKHYDYDIRRNGNVF